MPRRHVEIERTFQPVDGAELPELTPLLSGVAAVVEVREVGTDELHATYFDTAGLALLHAGVSLRHRTGGDDAGWHLKLARAAGSRTELHLPLDDSTAPPAELAGLVRGWTREEPLVEVALVQTTRSRRHLVDAGGTVLAEVADDTVTGLRTGGAPIRWRELEVELVDGDRDLLDAVTARLAEHDVPLAPVQRKLETVLGSTPPAYVEEPARDRPARLLVHRRLVAQVAELASSDPLARQGEPVGVHHLRRAARRLRALLATYRPLLERDVTDPVRDELRWLARALSAARDQEVVHVQLEEHAGALPLELQRGPVVSRIRSHHDRREQSELAEVGTALDSERYFALRAALEELAAAPPWTRRAGKRAEKVLPALVGREWKRLRHARRDAGEPHAVRKAAKRMRYAWEVLEPVWGAEAKAPRRAAKELTERLGAHQDGVVAQAALLDLADEALAAHEDTFTYGLLHARLQEAATQQLLDADAAWRRLAKLSR